MLPVLPDLKETWMVNDGEDRHGFQTDVRHLKSLPKLVKIRKPSSFEVFS